MYAGPQLGKTTGRDDTFAVVMSAVLKAVDGYGDLMRMSIAAPGNDFRLGAMEAPPAIMSTYYGDSLTNYLKVVKDSGKSPGMYNPAETVVNLGVSSVAPFTVPAEDRNRTSPFPYGGHRFEFRAVGSTQNVSMVNTVLCSAIAEAFNLFSDAIEGGQAPLAVAQASLVPTWKTIFNGDGYSAEWPVEAEKRGLLNIPSGVEATQFLARLFPHPIPQSNPRFTRCISVIFCHFICVVSECIKLLYDLHLKLNEIFHCSQSSP